MVEEVDQDKKVFIFLFSFVFNSISQFIKQVATEYKEEKEKMHFYQTYKLIKVKVFDLLIQLTKHIFIIHLLMMVIGSFQNILNSL
jgi:hypothetical protein